jgi:uncharacterized protein (DUF3084 family)
MTTELQQRDTQIQQQEADIRQKDAQIQQKEEELRQATVELQQKGAELNIVQQSLQVSLIFFIMHTQAHQLGIIILSVLTYRVCVLILRTERLG